MLNTLESLFKLARDRKKNPVEDSYTNKLLRDKSFVKEKVLEEIIELTEAVDENINLFNLFCSSIIVGSSVCLFLIGEFFNFPRHLSLNPSIK